MTKHIYRAPLGFTLDGADVGEVEAMVYFIYTPGSPEHYDKALGGWLPADDAEIELTDIVLSWRVGGIDVRVPDCPAWLFYVIAEKIDHEPLRQVVEDDYNAAKDAAAEARRE
jgi:hypothetical protein